MDLKIVEISHIITIPNSVLNDIKNNVTKKLVFEIINGIPYYFNLNKKDDDDNVEIKLGFRYCPEDIFNIYMMDNIEYINDTTINYTPKYFFMDDN